MENQGTNHDRKAMAVFQRVPPYLGIEMLKSQTGLQNQFNITDYQLTTDYLHVDIQKKWLAWQSVKDSKCRLLGLN